MIWYYILLSIFILLLILFLFYRFNIRIKRHLHNKCPEIVINTIILIFSVLIGALLALQFTKDLKRNDDEQNYISMLNSCRNKNERYLKSYKVIIDSMNSGSANYSQLNRCIENINQPFLLEEIIKNSDLYKCSSLDFRNWLPDIIFFIKANDWDISKENINKIDYNNHFLMFLNDIFINEENFVSHNLSEKQAAILDNKSRLKYSISTKDIPISDIIIEMQKKEVADSNNSVK